MIFRLQGDLGQLTAANRILLEPAISELLRSHRFGHHLVILERPQTDWLSKNIQLARAEQAMLMQIGKDYAQTAGLLSRAACYVTVMADRYEGIDKSGGELRIGLLDASRSYLLDRVALIIEDSQYDGELYDHILCRIGQINNCPALSFRLIHGGGERIVEVMKEYADEGRITLVLVDSDKNGPFSVESLKVKRLKARASVYAFTTVVVLNCREVENLIPIDVLRELRCATGREGTISLLLRIQAHEETANIAVDGRFSCYFDLKEGQSPATLQRMHDDDQEWIEIRLASIGLHAHGAHIPGFGETVIRQVLENGRALTLLRQAVGSNTWARMFAMQFMEIIWICAAPPRRVT